MYMNLNQRCRSILALLLVVFLLAPSVGYAAPQFGVSPLVIDGTGKPRDIMKFTITLKNTESHLVSVYPWVSNYTSASGTLSMPDLGNADLSTSLANWIEVTRGAIDLMPGETHDVPVLVQINLNAKPGVYHALISFSSGTNRAEAEANRSLTQEIPVNITVQDDANEKLQLGAFTPEKNWFTGSAAAFKYRLENIGNRGLVPKGKIRIYDRKGEEVATIDANQNGERLEPSAASQLAAVWQSGQSFGKYKAFLDIEYGDSGRGSIQDTVFFWVVPWQKILGMFLSIVIVSVIIAVLVHSRSRSGLAYARARAGYDEDEELDDEVDTYELPEREPIDETWEEDGPRESIMKRITKRFRRDVPSPYEPEVVEETISFESPIAQVSTLEKVNHRMREPSHEAVRLAPRKKSMPNPDHIVNLRR